MIEIEGCLKERDTSAHDFSLSSPLNEKEQQRGRPSASASATATDPDVGGGGGGSLPAQRNGVNIKPTKRQIEQRIEEDRERHKRMRESMWVVPPNPVDQARKFFAETSDLGEDDRILGHEEIAQFRARVKDSACKHHATRGRGGSGGSGGGGGAGGRREERPRPRATNGVARHI